jgi:hypothetical protein
MRVARKSRRAVDAARIDELVDFVIAAAEAGDGVLGPRADILATLMELLGVLPDPRAPADRWGLRQAWLDALDPWFQRGPLADEGRRR